MNPAILREFRASLPEIVEGRDPIAFRPPEFYLSRLRSYGADTSCSEVSERESGTHQGEAFHALASVKPVSPLNTHNTDSIPVSSNAGGNTSDGDGQGVGKARQGFGKTSQGGGHDR